MVSQGVFILLAALLMGTAQGMECSFERSTNIFQKLVRTCPPVLDPTSDKEYCCPDTEGNFYCCDAEEFALKTGLIVIVPAIIGVVAVLSIIIFCISCLCCSCCPWYRRRHRGTVYGKVHTPAVVTVVQQPGTTMHVVPQPQAGYPIQTASHLPAQPPPYTVEAYSKQAPYNPEYQQH